MKRFTLFNVLWIFLVGVSSFAPATKYKFSPTEGKCSIVFPSEFSEETKEKEDYTMIKGQVTDDGMVLIATCTIHNTPLDDVDLLTEVSLNSFISSLNATTKSKTNWNVKKHKGLQVEFESTEQNMIGELRVIIVGQIQYQIVAVGSNEDWDVAKAQKFLNSFKLTK